MSAMGDHLHPLSSLRSSFDAARAAVLSRDPPQRLPSNLDRPSSSSAPRPTTLFDRRPPRKSTPLVCTARSSTSDAGPMPPPRAANTTSRPLSSTSRTSSANRHQSSSSSSSTTHYGSLAMALWSTGARSSDYRAVLSAYDSLPLAARPFSFAFTPPTASSKPVIRNMYAPKHVEGRGWVSALYEEEEKRERAANELALALGSRRMATTSSGNGISSGPRYQTRRGVKPIGANGEEPSNAKDAMDVIVNGPTAEAPTPLPLPAPTQSQPRSHKSKAQQRAKLAKMRALAVVNAAVATSNESTPVPPTTAESTAAGKRKRARLDGDDVESLGGAEKEAEEEPEGKHGTRSSKRRKVATVQPTESEVMMPPPAVVPARSHKKIVREPAMVEEEEPSTARKTRPTRKAKGGAPMAQMESMDSAPSVEVEKVTRASRSAAAKKHSPSPSISISTGSGSDSRKVSAASGAHSIASTLVDEQRKSSSPVMHAYSTRRAALRSNSTDLAMRTPTQSSQPLGDGKERTSPSGSDETLVDQHAMMTRDDKADVILDMERTAVAPVA